MATNPRNKKPASPTSWERVHVIEGDPCLVRFALDMILSEAGSPLRIRLTSDDMPQLRQLLTTFPLFDTPPAYIFLEPNADACARLLDIIQSGKIKATALVILAGETGLDGRTVIAKEAKKFKRVMRLEPIAADDTRGLLEHLKGWQEESGISLDKASIEFLKANRPVRPIKGAKGADAQALDLEVLESELTKVATVAKANGKVCPEGAVAQLCDFDAAPQDVWSFVRSASNGDTRKALRYLDDMGVAKDNLGPLWLLLSQLEFLISVESVRAAKKGIVPEALAILLSENPFAGKYTLPSGEMPSKAVRIKAVNSWRIRKALEEGVPDLERLVASYRSVVNAIRDIRSDIPVSVATLLLTLALAGLCQYEAPLSAPQEAENRVVTE